MAPLGQSIHGQDQLTALGTAQPVSGSFQRFLPHNLWLGHGCIAAGRLDLLHKDQILAAGPHVEGYRSAVSWPSTPPAPPGSREMPCPTPPSPPCRVEGGGGWGEGRTGREGEHSGFAKH